MGRVPEEVIEKIIDSNDIVDVISEFVPLKRSGRGYMGVCPFHNDKGPSMSVSSEKQLFHCFGCGASGNVIGFIMRIRNLDFIEAVRYLGDRVGIKLERTPDNPEAVREQMLKDKLYEINIEAARFYFRNLFENEKPLNYLLNRNLDGKTIKKFGLGYSLNSWDSLLKYLKLKGYSEKLVYMAGLLSKKESSYYDKFRNRIMFPVFDVKGRVIGFGGRVMDDSKPKYLNSPETPVFVKGTNLYGLNMAIKPRIPESIIIVEGYMDLISLHQHGITNAVASLGTAMTLEQAKLLKRYSKDIYICYDADAAGQAATLRGLDILSSVGCNVMVIMIPRGKDPDEFIRTYGVEEFKKIIKNAIPVIDYRILKAKEGKNLKDATQKTEFVNSVAAIISKLDNEIEIQAYASKTSDETGIDVNSILDQVRKIKQYKVGKNNKRNLNDNVIRINTVVIEPAYKKAERQLLKFSVLNKDYFDYIRNKINPDEFITFHFKKAAKLIFHKQEKGEKFTPNDILKDFHDKTEIDDVSSIFVDDGEKEDEFKVIDDYIKTIKKINIENRINEITLSIKKYEEEKDIIKSAALSQELILLRNKLTML
ncbi:DNA primase [Fonticella tunisiensis]|uniref:DNA primase n=1 Tax=Fonticella tunisiensis TaxID=1096341 RepID=A0A4R7KDR8_9CLOT|nr:DNA primase [Fonticella tunisiensis]TDT51085.1 DNA primase [Fonticella tunisiensis]